MLLRAERASDTEFFRKITWIHVHELDDGAMLAAGRPVSEPVFRVQVTIPLGALSERRKQELVSEATRVVSEAAGLGDQDGLRVWILINEVPDGNWGAAGAVVQFEQLRQYAAAEREHPAAPSSPPPTSPRRRARLMSATAADSAPPETGSRPRASSANAIAGSRSSSTAGGSLGSAATSGTRPRRATHATRRCVSTTTRTVAIA